MGDPTEANEVRCLAGQRKVHKSFLDRIVIDFYSK